MSYSAEEAAVTRELMKKLLEVVGTDPVSHSVAINALVNLATNMARKYPCCTVGVGEMFMQIGANLLFSAGPPPQPDDEARPPGQHLH